MFSHKQGNLSRNPDFIRFFDNFIVLSYKKVRFFAGVHDSSSDTYLIAEGYSVRYVRV